MKFSIFALMGGLFLLTNGCYGTEDRYWNGEYALINPTNGLKAHVTHSPFKVCVQKQYFQLRDHYNKEKGITEQIASPVWEEQRLCSKDSLTVIEGKYHSIEIKTGQNRNDFENELKAINIISCNKKLHSLSCTKSTYIEFLAYRILDDKPWFSKEEKLEGFGKEIYK